MLSILSRVSSCLEMLICETSKGDKLQPGTVKLVKRETRIQTARKCLHEKKKTKQKNKKRDKSVNFNKKKRHRAAV